MTSTQLTLLLRTADLLVMTVPSGYAGLCHVASARHRLLEAREAVQAEAHALGAVALVDGTELRPLAPEPPSVVLGRAATALTCPALALVRGTGEHCADAMKELRGNG